MDSPLNDKEKDGEEDGSRKEAYVCAYVPHLILDALMEKCIGLVSKAASLMNEWG